MSSFTSRRAGRLAALPPYLFAAIDEKKLEAISKGAEIIDLGVGDPDIPTPPMIIDALAEAAREPSNHRYPSYAGLRGFKEAASGWYKRRFGVDLDAGSEILSLIGSKEGIAHLPLALIDPGETVLVPDPAYPVYLSGTIFAGGKPFIMPLREENGFLPDLGAIPPEVLDKARVIFINYPNNPTGAVADRGFFEDLVSFSRKNEIIVCHDAAYTEMTFEGYVAPSFLEIDGAKDVGIEFHSCSKTFSMTGWRVGFAAGNAKVLSALGDIKKNIDSGIFQAVQIAAIEALKNDEEARKGMNDIYRERRDILVAALNGAGWPTVPPRGTFYVWTRPPDSMKGISSADIAARLLDEAAIVATPGRGFGEYGEGFIRMALTVETERIREAGERIGSMAGR